MLDESSGYDWLLDFAEAWSEVARIPKQMVLRRIIEWAVTGAFPAGTFITCDGEEVKPLWLLAAWRAWWAAANGAAPHSRALDIKLGASTCRIPLEMAENLLEDALVCVGQIEAFHNGLKLDDSAPLPPCAAFAALEANDFVSVTPEPSLSCEPEPAAQVALSRRSARGDAYDDSQLLDEIEAAMIADPEPSARTVSQRFADRAAGGGTLQSRAARLRRKLRERQQLRVPPP